MALIVLVGAWRERRATCRPARRPSLVARAARALPAASIVNAWPLAAACAHLSEHPRRRCRHTLRAALSHSLLHMIMGPPISEARSSHALFQCWHFVYTYACAVQRYARSWGADMWSSVAWVVQIPHRCVRVCQTTDGRVIDPCLAI